MNQEKKSPKRQLGVLDLAHQFLRAHVREGDTVIDATCGRGNDTKLLCALAGESGRVIGFDIQQDAIDSAYRSYHALGGNGTITQVHNEIMQMQIQN